ncbi:hypothetical protein [Microbacter margulisiae]|uniref:Transposase-like protein n=1 Tax=Microbacter margulisiae TaxID=1350067 RepID=A0A7W5H126_9PORP|nr:hypothetical protein [Microbacter margulisiae]MBB3185901.1 transposase-like protein [Microbacter margulisiae]
MGGIKNQYVKRTQKDYSMSLKLSIISEIERGDISVTSATKKYGIQGRSTVVGWLRKYGTFDWENQTPGNMPKSKDQKINVLEKQKAFLEKQAEQSDMKAAFFDMMVDMAEKEYNISIRKNSLPEQSTDSAKKTK